MKECENIKVSVIIYVKNTINYIEQCIRSVMDQTLKEIEILVVDGGSTDGTLDDKVLTFFHFMIQYA